MSLNEIHHSVACDEAFAKDAEIARLQAANDKLRASLDAHQNDPVCGDHAETWYCERPTVTFTPTEDAPQGCFLCEIARLKADLARVRGQRDRLALGYAATPSALESVGLRIVGGTVEEIGS